MLLNENDAHLSSNYRKKNYNVMIYGINVFDQPIKNDISVYGSVRKIAIGPGDDYIAGFLLNYPYFIDNHKLIVTVNNNLLIQI